LPPALLSICNWSCSTSGEQHMVLGIPLVLLLILKQTFVMLWSGTDILEFFVLWGGGKGNFLCSKRLNETKHASFDIFTVVLFW